MKIIRTKPTVYVMIGPAGSGKSTWLKNNLGPNFPITSKDSIREDLGVIGPDGKKKVGIREQENKVSEIQEEQINNFLKKHVDFAIDNTNLGKSLEKLLGKLRKFDVLVVGVKIYTPLPTLIQRRPEIPREVLEDMFRKSQRIDSRLFDKFIEVK